MKTTKQLLEMLCHCGHTKALHYWSNDHCSFDDCYCRKFGEQSQPEQREIDYAGQHACFVDGELLGTFPTYERASYFMGQNAPQWWLEQERKDGQILPISRVPNKSLEDAKDIIEQLLKGVNPSWVTENLNVIGKAYRMLGKGEVE
jgi:hypothetical protein